MLTSLEQFIHFPSNRNLTTKDVAHSITEDGCGNHKHSLRAYFQVWATEYEVIVHNCFNHVFDNKGRGFCTHKDKSITAKKKAPTVFLSRIIPTTISYLIL